MNTMKRSVLLSAAAVAVAAVGTGCMPDRELAIRERTTQRLRAEVRAKVRDVAHCHDYRKRLLVAIQANTTIEDRTSLADELCASGFEILEGEEGTLRLLLDPSASRGPDAVTVSRLARVAGILRRRLPDHELSVESGDITKAVRAVRALNEKAGVPGSALRAAIGRTPGLVVEVRPTRMESLQEVLAATME
jgi:hypothetical protein